MTLQQVQLGFRDTSGDEWTARAAHGELVAQDSGVVQLAGNVQVAGTLPGSGETAADRHRAPALRHATRRS